MHLFRIRLTRICMLLTVVTFLAGCIGSITEAHSQWRGDEKNKNRLATMYAKSLPICDKKLIAAHKVCVDKIRKEFSKRFATRFNAYYTAKSAETLLVKAVVISYLTSEMAKVKNKTNTNASVVKKNRLCSSYKLSRQFSGSLSSFTVIPVSCS